MPFAGDGGDSGSRPPASGSADRSRGAAADVDARAELRPPSRPAVTPPAGAPGPAAPAPASVRRPPPPRRHRRCGPRARTATAPATEPSPIPVAAPARLRCRFRPVRGAAAATAPAPRQPVNPFLATDPSTKARRLARALISDLVVYHPAKRADGIRDGTLKLLFEEEIKKCWEEYTDQVGLEMATSTGFFTEALNEILADGQPVFS